MLHALSFVLWDEARNFLMASSLHSHVNRRRDSVGRHRHSCARPHGISQLAQTELGSRSSSATAEPSSFGHADWVGLYYTQWSAAPLGSQRPILPVASFTV